MKVRVAILVSMFCIACLVVSGVYAKGKPDKPGKPSDQELITFWGDFRGSEVVEGCCPNAGPFPPYELHVYRDLGEGDHQVPEGTYSGHLFLSGSSKGRNPEYIFQFWDAGQDIWLEVRGGAIDYDKRTKVTTVVFENEECVCGHGELIDTVNFTLERKPWTD